MPQGVGHTHTPKNGVTLGPAAPKASPACVSLATLALELVDIENCHEDTARKEYCVAAH